VLRELCRPQAKDDRAPCSTTKDIAARLFVGEAAVKAHLGSLYLKFEVPEEGQQRRALLAQRAWETGAVRRSDFDDAPID
jgi:Bacterial regulatory proteins, luxR family